MDNQTGFIDMWSYMSVETIRTKKRCEVTDYFDNIVIKLNNIPRGGNYACEEAYNRICEAREVDPKSLYWDEYICEHMCDYCPVSWGARHCVDEGSVLRKWYEAKDDAELSAQLANEIKDLPWN